VELLLSDQDVPYRQVTRALSAILAPMSFEELRGMGLYPGMLEGLGAKVPDIQLLALDQTAKMSEMDDDMVTALIDCFGAEDPGVGKRAVEVITAVNPFPQKSTRRFSLFLFV